ncbi:MAG: LysE family transporter [Nitrososphaeraceae archaeon]
MNTFEFAIEVILLSASGVLSPGPLFFANLIYGSTQGFRGGIKTAYGHTIVELPIIIILSIGLFHFSAPVIASNEILRFIGLLGGITIIFLSVLQIRSIMARNKNNVVSGDIPGNRSKYALGNKPIIGGILFSLLNPFFLVWWFTVGLKIISDSISLFGILLGSLAVFIFHIWMDYAWLGGTSYFAFRGISILTSRFYTVVLLGLNLLLLIYGLYWIIVNVY